MLQLLAFLTVFIGLPLFANAECASGFTQLSDVSVCEQNVGGSDPACASGYGPVSDVFVCQPGVTTVPPPPSLRGNVVHIPTSGSDQTFAVQAAINSAGPGDTIFFDQGGHIVCGGITYKAGQLYIGPSISFPLLGQNGRATIDGCNGSGQFTAASNTTTYGLNFTNIAPWNIFGTTGVTLRNTNIDQSGTRAEIWQRGGDTNTTIDWSTFTNISGADNGGFGGQSTNLYIGHNVFNVCDHDCLSLDDLDALNEVVEFNYFHAPGQTCNGCGVGGAIEAQFDPTTGHGRKSARFSDNYTDGIVGFNFAYSIVAGGGGNYQGNGLPCIEIARNFAVGKGAAIEYDSDLGTYPGGCTNVHDNFLDGLDDSANPGDATIFGPYQDQATSGPPRSSQSGNRLIAGPGFPAHEVDGSFSCTMPCLDVIYTPGPTNNPGPPPKPPSGAAP